MATLPSLPKLPQLPKLPGLRDDLSSSEGLYGLAHDSGLKDKADEIVRLNSGEEHQKFFAGGFISDTFDILNIASYGVVGTLKGKGFAEGIKNRESFSDQDALGQFGLVGVVGGIALDIATDPFTYIAPWKILSKVPGLSKAAKAGKERLLGKPTEQVIDETGRTFQSNIGGVPVVKELADKVVWMLGKDPAFRETYETMLRNTGIGIEKAHGLFKLFAKFDPIVSDKLLTKLPAQFEGGVERLARKDINLLQRELSPEQFAPVKEAWDMIDNLGKQLVDLGVLSKEKFEENIGTYIQNNYDEFLKAKNKGSFAARTLGIKGTKSRVEELTAEKAKELGQIENPAYLLGKTMIDMVKDVENAKFFKVVNEKWGTDVAQEGFSLVPKTKKFQTSFGKVAELRKQVGVVNEQLKPLFKELKQTFGSDKKVLSELNALEQELLSAGTKRAEELTKFFQYGGAGAKVTETPRKLGIIDEALQPIASKVKGFKTYEDMLNSDVGVQLENLDINGDLQRKGFQSMEDFFNTVKSPFTPAKTGVKGATVPELTKKFDATYGFKKIDDVPTAGVRTDVVRTGDKVIMKELSLLAKKIRDFNRGFRLGKKITTHEISQAQSAIIKVIKKNFKVADQAKFLNKIKSATTPDKLEELVSKLSDDFSNILERDIEQLGMGNLSKAQQLQKRIEQMVAKSKNLSELDKSSINDSFINLERQISDLRFGKEDLMGEIQKNVAGDLAGKYIPDSMAKYVNEVADPKSAFGSKLVGEFKYMKVVFSPATHMRNIISNKILNWWKLGIGPWRFDLDAAAIKDIKTNSEMYQRAKRAGMGGSTYASNELGQLLDNPTANLSKKFGFKQYGQLKHAMGEMYQHEEDFAKLVAFKEMIKKGMKDDEAWKAAESATFNYAQVTPFVRQLRTALWGVPFITFPLKATPIAIEAALKNTSRVSFFGKFRTAMENLSDQKETEEEKKTIPDYIRNGFFVKLPMKDENGRSSYFDLTYIIPFGDLMSGQLFERPISRETGLKEGLPLSVASKNPALNVIKELMRNQTFSGTRIWKDTDSLPQQLSDMNIHLLRTMSPPWMGDQLPGGYNTAGERVSTGFAKSLEQGTDPNQRRTFIQELFKNIGLKVTPFDVQVQESINDYNKQKGLRQLLQDNGVAKDFSRVYQPK